MVEERGVLDPLLLPPTDITGAAVNILAVMKNDSGLEVDGTDSNTLCLDENYISFEVSCGQPVKTT